MRFDAFIRTRRPGRQARCQSARNSPPDDNRSGSVSKDQKRGIGRVAVLASEKARYITVQAVVVDGGLHKIN
jgi:hypothetical protein